MREIQIPNDIIRLSENQLKIMVQNNDDILLSFCKQKRLKYGAVTNFGLLWRDYNEFKKDADSVCHEYYQLLVVFPKGMVIAPCHADEVFNLGVDPWTNEKLNL